VKKISSIILALVLVAGLGAVTAVSTVSASPATWYVVEGGAGDETGVSWASAFADIQDAVEAASDGDTIEVAAGNYGAFSVIGKSNISIIGAEGATVTAGDWVSINRGPIGDAWSMAAVKDSQNINIQGIDFDGTALSKEEVVVGIAYVDSTGRIANLTVENTMGAELGVGVAIIGHAGTSSVNLVDVTVRKSMAGVIIWGAEANLDGCTITEMRPNGGFDIMGSGVGVVIGIPGAAYHGPSTVKVKGSTISDNNDIGVYVCDGSFVEAHFNRIVGNAALGVLNDGGQSVDALYNWWGGAAGPLHPSNPAGVGNNAVSDNVDFQPWLWKESKTETVVEDKVVDALFEADTEVWVTFAPTATVAAYTENPGGDPDFEVLSPVTVVVTEYAYNPEKDAPLQFVTLGKHIDVFASGTKEVSEIEIRLYYRDDDVGNVSRTIQQYFRLLWWDGSESEWKQCEETDVTIGTIKGYDGYIWARITADTTPSLRELEGTPFGGYGGPPPIPVCFIATAVYGTDTAEEIDILREFRDVILLPNSLGAGFVSLYHRTSPPIADLISRHEVLRTAVRVGLVDPIVAVLERSQDLWLARGSPG